MNAKFCSVLFAIAAGVNGFEAASASTFTFNVDYNIGSDVVTGQITTNCDLCLVSSSDVVSWSLSDSDGNADSSLLSGASISGGSNLEVLQNGIELTGTGTPTSFLGSNNQHFFSFGDGGNVSAGGSFAVDGTLSVPAAIATAPVPLPSAGWMLLTGIAGLFLVRRDRRSRSENLDNGAPA